MKTWKRSLFPHFRCGACGKTIGADAPYLEYQLPAISRVLLRCRTCAEEPVPDVLPVALPRPRLALPEWTPVPALVHQYAPPRAPSPRLQATLDARLAAIRAATSRDPGEEG
jgi:hypothetical protein